MTATGFLDILFMDAEAEQECREVVSTARPTILRLAKKHCDGSIKDFHRDYELGKFGVIPDMEVMRDVIARLLSGYGSQIASVAGSFANSPRIRRETLMDYDDWFQEACMAFSEAIYSYDGSSKFNTYAITNVRNALRDKVRYIRSAKRVADKLVHESELGGGGENGETLTLEMLAVDRDTSEIGGDSEYDATTLREVLASLALTPLERDLLAGAADGERGWQVKIAKRHNNPKTLQPYTRAGVSFVFQQLCKKIRDTYHSFMINQRVAA